MSWRLALGQLRSMSSSVYAPFPQLEAFSSMDISCFSVSHLRLNIFLSSPISSCGSPAMTIALNQNPPCSIISSISLDIARAAPLLWTPVVVSSPYFLFFRNHEANSVFLLDFWPFLALMLKLCSLLALPHNRLRWQQIHPGLWVCF
jgi:hypothetical protein